MSYRWRLWCTIHGWVYGWDDNPITQCPIENSDPVDTNKTFQVGEEKGTVELTPTTYRIRSKNYQRVTSMVYDSETKGPLHRATVLSFMDSNLTSYSVEIYDKTNEVSLVETTFSNTGDFSENFIDIIPNPPEGKVVLEINMKVNGVKNKYAYISQIVLYSSRKTV